MQKKRSAGPRKPRKVAARRSAVKPGSGALRAKMPEAIRPMLATLVDDPFTNPDWVFETKWDGFRSICFLNRGKARFVSRNQLDMTPQYPELEKLARQFDAK